jgi:hypothetical protein
LIEPLIGVRWRCGGRSRRLLDEQTSHLLAALHSEGTEALAAQMQQLFALGVAQLLPAHQVVGALVVAGDAVAREHLAHHALPRIRRATSCAGAGLAVAWQIHGPAAP